MRCQHKPRRGKDLVTDVSGTQQGMTKQAQFRQQMITEMENQLERYLERYKEELRRLQSFPGSSWSRFHLTTQPDQRPRAPFPWELAKNPDITHPPDFLARKHKLSPA